MAQKEKRSAYRTGWLVFIGLAIVTAFEFYLSTVSEGALLYLTITSLIKAGLIIHYFMHASQAWHGEAQRE